MGTEPQIQSLIRAARLVLGSRCPIFGHADDGSRRRRVDCADDQCVNPECVRYVECAHPWHGLAEAIADVEAQR